MQIIKEIQIQRNLLRNCGSVVKILKVYESDDFINIVMDYHEGGSLSSYICEKGRVIPEKTCKLIMA